MLEIERDPYVHHSCEHLKHLGVKAVFFDLDDTCIHTHSMFIDHMRSFSEAVAIDLHLDPEKVFHRLHEINTEEHQRPGVEPSRWLTIVDCLGQELGNSQTVLKHFPIIQDIYISEPQTIPGIRSVLSGLQKEGFLLGQVTHGETDWSLRKNDQSGITSYFDAIITADVYDSKNESHWLQAMSLLEVTPEQCLITGDSLHGDIRPAVALGAKSFGLKSPWGVFNQGDYPSETVILNRISDFWDAVQKLV
ncbi:MAG TPA: HAD family hydrolase [Candidatus Woesebacteria bacterium]|nr:HAD family hydrolase [Candidatus Woesebacteria bacterium]